MSAHNTYSRQEIIAGKMFGWSVLVCILISLLLTVAIVMK